MQFWIEFAQQQQQTDLFGKHFLHVYKLAETHLSRFHGEKKFNSADASCCCCFVATQVTLSRLVFLLLPPPRTFLPSLIVILLLPPDKNLQRSHNATK
jgi:hypothetical protein